MRKIIRHWSVIFLLLAASCALFSVDSFAANKMWWATGLTGGSGALDGIDGESLTDGDGAFVFRDNSGTYEGYFYRLEDYASNPPDESSPDTITPDTNSGSKRWKLLTVSASTFTGDGSGLTGLATTAADNTWTGTNTYTTTVAFQQTDGTPICTMPTAPPGANSILECSPAGTGGWVETGSITATGGVTIESASSGQIACWHTDETSLTSCGTPQTDNSTASHLLCKDSDGHIENCGGVTISGTTSPIININPQEVNGSTAGSLSAVQVTNTTVYNTGQTDDTYLTLPTAAAGLQALFTVGTTVAKYWGVRAGTNDKIYLIASSGAVTAGSDNGYVRMTSAQIGQAFACWTFKTDAYDWMCKAISIGTSTFVVP